MATPRLTIITFGGRFTVESDQYEPDPKFANVQTCMMLTSKGTLAKAGNSWATRKGAEDAIARFKASGKPSKIDWLGLAQGINEAIEKTQLYPGEIVTLLNKHGMVKAQHPEVIAWAKEADRAAGRYD